MSAINATPAKSDTKNSSRVSTDLFGDEVKDNQHDSWQWRFLTTTFSAAFRSKKDSVERWSGSLLLTVMDVLLDANVRLAKHSDEVSVQEKKELVAAMFSPHEISQVSEVPLENWGVRQLDRLVQRNVRRNALVWADDGTIIERTLLLSTVVNAEFLASLKSVQTRSLYNWNDASTTLLAEILLDLEFVRSCDTKVDLINDVYEWIFCDDQYRREPFSFENCIKRLPARYDVNKIEFMIDASRDEWIRENAAELATREALQTGQLAMKF